MIVWHKFYTYFPEILDFQLIIDLKLEFMTRRSGEPFEFVGDIYI